MTADPTYLHGEKIDAAGNGTNDGEFTGPFDFIRAKYSLDGYRSWSPTTDKLTLNIRSYCKPKDAWCQSAWPAGQGIHNSYGDPTIVSEILSFFAKFE